MEPVATLKRPSSEDYSQCVFCQTSRKNENLRNASEMGIQTLQQAVQSRKKLMDSKNIDVIDRLDTAFDSEKEHNLVWHKSCYGIFTDKNKIQRLQVEHTTPTKAQTSTNKTSSLRKATQPVDWNKCMFCQERKSKVPFRSVMTQSLSDQIIRKAHVDYSMNIRLAGVIDLIAAEAKYHLPCLSLFTRSTMKLQNEYGDQDLAMTWLCRELKQASVRGHVLELDDVWKRYEQLVKDSNTTIPSSFYSRRSTFKAKLQLELGDSYYFYQPLDRCISERKTILIPPNCREQAEADISMNCHEYEDSLTEMPEYKSPDDDFLSLIHIALKIRGDIIEMPGHEGFCVNKDAAIACVPDSLYMFLQLVFGGQNALECDSCESSEDSVHRQVLSIAQDFFYGISGGRKLTPKHIGLGSTLHQATRSRHLVELFHKAGHCISYRQVLQVDTSLAECTLKSLELSTGAVMPSNFVESEFIHYTADNIDILNKSILL